MYSRDVKSEKYGSCHVVLVSKIQCFFYEHTRGACDVLKSETPRMYGALSETFCIRNFLCGLGAHVTKAWHFDVLVRGLSPQSQI